jgi:hypothetical protein
MEITKPLSDSIAKTPASSPLPENQRGIAEPFFAFRGTDFLTDAGIHAGSAIGSMRPSKKT